MKPSSPWWRVLGLLVLVSCHPGTRPLPSYEGYPRCLAADADGNQVVCAASPRAYDGERCICDTRQGLRYYGRIQEYPR